MERKSLNTKDTKAASKDTQNLNTKEHEGGYEGHRGTLPDPVLSLRRIADGDGVHAIGTGGGHYLLRIGSGRHNCM